MLVDKRLLDIHLSVDDYPVGREAILIRQLPFIVVDDKSCAGYSMIQDGSSLKSKVPPRTSPSRLKRFRRRIKASHVEIADSKYRHGD